MHQKWWIFTKPHQIYKIFVSASENNRALAYLLLVVRWLHTLLVPTFHNAVDQLQYIYVALPLLQIVKNVV